MFYQFCALSTWAQSELPWMRIMAFMWQLVPFPSTASLELLSCAEEYGPERPSPRDDGAWSCQYDSSLPELPPIIKIGMAPDLPRRSVDVGNRLPDKLVVIPDGAEPDEAGPPSRATRSTGTSFPRRRTVPVTCGFSPVPEWIQSERSMIVYGYGAFVEQQHSTIRRQ